MRVALTVLVWMLMIGGAVMVFAGCGNVTLRGDAMTAAQTSALDAANAATRAGADPNTAPWLTAYTVENAQQWRSFVRSANTDPNWGPKLAGE